MLGALKYKDNNGNDMTPEKMGRDVAADLYDLSHGAVAGFDTLFDDTQGLKREDLDPVEILKALEEFTRGFGAEFGERIKLDRAAKADRGEKPTVPSSP